MKRFRLIAIDETDKVTLPEGATQLYGIYLFCEGEATHCCSIAPSTWLEPIDVAIIYPDWPPEGDYYEQTYRSLLDQHYDCGHYVPYIDPENLPALTSRAIEIDITPGNFDDEGSYRDALWDEAIDAARSNPPTVGGIYP